MPLSRGYSSGTSAFKTDASRRQPHIVAQWLDVPCSYPSHYACHPPTLRLSADQASMPIEKQIQRWREEVFTLLLANKQGQAEHKAQAAEAEDAQKALEQQLAAAEARALLLDSRLVDRQVSRQSWQLVESQTVLLMFAAMMLRIVGQVEVEAATSVL